MGLRIEYELWNISHLHMSVNFKVKITKNNVIHTNMRLIGILVSDFHSLFVFHILGYKFTLKSWWCIVNKYYFSFDWLFQNLFRNETWDPVTFVFLDSLRFFDEWQDKSIVKNKTFIDWTSPGCQINFWTLTK